VASSLAVTRFGGTRVLTALLVALLVPLGTAQRAAAVDPDQPPDVVLPADGVTDEDSAFYFDDVSNVITVTDPDAGTDEVELDLSVTSGVLHFADPTGLTFVNGTANDSDTLEMTGSLDAFDAALDKLQVMPAPDDTDTVTLTAVVDDLGHNGDGGPLTDSDTMDISVNPVNDAPVVTVPGAQSIEEDTTATFSGATANPITVSDVDAGTADVQVTLASNFGTATVATTNGLSFSNGDGTDDGQMTFTATLDDANAALDGLTFAPDPDFDDVTGHGTATLTVTADDQGASGSGGGLADQEMVSFAVAPVNDAPVDVVPSGLGTYAGVPKVLSRADLNAVGVDEVDSAGAEIEVALTATHGTLTLASLTGVTIVGGADGSGSITFRATDGDTTVALDGLTFAPAAGFTGQADVTIHTDDLGNTGSGGALTDTDTFPITVSAPGDTVYWGAAKDTPAGLSGAISRAALDGSGGANLVTGSNTSDTPNGVAIDTVHGRLYWSNTSAVDPSARGIWSANLDGTDPQLFLTPAMATTAGTTLSSAFSPVVDQRTRRLYWANSDATTPANRGISWVSLDDTSVGGRIDTTGATVGSPRAMAIDTVHDRVYFANWSTSQSLAWAALDGSGGGTFTVNGALVSQPSGIAYDAATNRLFWANGTGETAPERLKVATLPVVFGSSITGATVDLTPLPGGGLRSLAIDPVAGRVYFDNTSVDHISSVALDGSGGGTDLALGSAFGNSPEGLAILRHPAALGVPALTGATTLGATLTCGAVTWAADDPGAALYRTPASTAIAWTRDGAPIAGATGATVTADTAGAYRCRRTATNFAGTTTADSAPLTVAGTPRLSLGAAGVAVSRSGRVVVPVSCATSACGGTLALRSGATALGTASFSLAAGGSGAVTIDLTTAGRALVSGRASVDVSAVVTLTGASTTASVLTLLPARAPAVALLSGKARLKGGKVAVKLGCPADAGDGCRGTLVLTATIAGHVKTLATATVRIGAGGKDTVKLRLSKAARKALRSGALAATQTMTSDVEVGLDTVTTRGLALKG
jgi:hypothetical protein